MGLWRRLQRRAERFGDVRVAVFGAGYAGTGVVHAIEQTPGMRVSLVVNRTPARAVDALARLGTAASDVVVSDSRTALAAAIRSGIPAAAGVAAPVAELPIDVAVEATGAIDYGTETILNMLDAGKHVVSLNAECDALLGPLFHGRARRNGVVYTIADGDQPGVQCRLQEHVRGMGFEVIASVNCKRHLDVHQNPSSGSNYAARDATSARMTTAFGDGTKMQIEQAVVANATGLVPDRRGMRGIASSLATAAVDLPAALSAPGRVDFTIGGDFGAGVGVVGRHPQPELHARALRLYKMGDGPNYFFFRPYHLVHLEVPRTIAEVCLDREPIAGFEGVPATEVIALAKRDLHAGEALDGIGGFTTYGLIDTAAGAAGYLPVCLTEFASLICDVKMDQPIRLDAVRLDEAVAPVAEWKRLREVADAHGLSVRGSPW